MVAKYEIRALSDHTVFTETQSLHYLDSDTIWKIIYDAIFCFHDVFIGVFNSVILFHQF